MAGCVGRQPISRPSNFKQAGERYRAFEPWEQDALVKTSRKPCPSADGLGVETHAAAE